MALALGRNRESKKLKWGVAPKRGLGKAGKTSPPAGGESEVQYATKCNKPMFMRAFLVFGSGTEVQHATGAQERPRGNQRVDQPTAPRDVGPFFEPRPFFRLHLQQTPGPEVPKIPSAPAFSHFSKLELTS